MELLTLNPSTAEALAHAHFLAFARNRDGKLQEAQLAVCLTRLCNNAGLHSTCASIVLKELRAKYGLPATPRASSIPGVLREPKFAVGYQEFLEAFLHMLPPPAPELSTSTLGQAGAQRGDGDKCSHRTLTPPQSPQSPEVPVAEALESTGNAATDWRRCAALLVLNPATTEANARACYDRICGGASGSTLQRLPARYLKRCLASLCENVGLPVDSPAGALASDVANEFAMELRSNSAGELLGVDGRPKAPIPRISQDSVTREEFCRAFQMVLNRAAISPEMEDGLRDRGDALPTKNDARATPESPGGLLSSIDVTAPQEVQSPTLTECPSRTNLQVPPVGRSDVAEDELSASPALTVTPPMPTPPSPMEQNGAVREVLSQATAHEPRPVPADGPPAKQPGITTLLEIQALEELRLIQERLGNEAAAKPRGSRS